MIGRQLGAADYLRKTFALDEVPVVAGAHADALASATDRPRATNA